MHKLSKEFIRDYADLMVGQNMVLNFQVDDESSVTISSGKVSDNPETWGWAVNFNSDEGRESLTCVASWGDNDWQRYGRNHQGVLWRPTYWVEDEEVVPAANTVGGTIDWRYQGRGLKSGHALHAGVYVDLDNQLSDFLQRSLELSDIDEMAEEIIRVRKITSREGWIGFLGLSGVDARHVRPSLFTTSLPLKEKIFRIHQLSGFVQSVLRTPNPEFKAKAQLKAPGG